MRDFRRYIAVWLFAVILAGCKEKQTTLITGQIVDYDEPYITLTDKYLAYNGTAIPVDKNGKFRYEIPLSEDKDYFLKIGWYFIKIYLRPGDSIHLYGDYKRLGNTMHFSGNTTQLNNMWLEMGQINREKNKILRSFIELKDTFSVNYIVKEFRKLKLEKLTEYRNLHKIRLDNPLKKRLTEHLIYTDDWRSYEIYNYYFPDNPYRYTKEIPFTWEGTHVKSYSLLQYAVRFFLNRHPDLNINNPFSIEQFARDVDQTIPDDKDLAETVKLVNMELLLRKNFFQVDHQVCNNLYEQAGKIFRSDEHKERFYDFLEAFFSSVKDGYFPRMDVKDFACNEVALHRKLAQKPVNYLYTFSDLESFNQHLPDIKKMYRTVSKDTGITVLFTGAVNKQILKAVLEKNGLPEDGNYFLTRRKIVHYNYWRMKTPLLFEIDSTLHIKEVNPL